jgi:hypothetical protein
MSLGARPMKGFGPNTKNRENELPRGLGQIEGWAAEVVFSNIN